MADKTETKPVDILSVLKDLCRLMSSAPLTVVEVRKKLAGMPFRSSVAAEPGSSAPAFARLEMPPGAGLTLEALQHEFGPAHQAPGMGRGAPAEYLIYVDLPGYPYTCALVIEKELEKPSVEAVTVRRDIRLT